MATYKRTLKRMPTTVWQLMSKTTLARVVLDFIRTTRAGRRFQKREREEGKTKRDEKWGMENGRIEGNDKKNEREAEKGRRRVGG